MRAVHASLLALAMITAVASGGCWRLRPDPPNVLFILTDDLRWDALGSYGNEQIRTPNLDALAAEGMSFDAFYAASPVCVASRINFLTGRHFVEQGIAVRPLPAIEPGTPTLPMAFSDAGYATAFIGKAHASVDPDELGFAEAPLYHPGKRPFSKPTPSLWVRRRSPQHIYTIEVPGDPTSLIVDAARGWIEQHRDERWFLWLATTAPHYPYFAHDAHPYDAEALGPPPGEAPGLPIGHRKLWRLYYSQISYLDEQLGRLFETLDAAGLRENTLVVFTSDNGIMHGSHGVLTKGVWHEPSTRLPMIARWPGVVPAGTRNPGLASSVDLYPTLLELLGRRPDTAREGHSFGPMLRGEASTRDAVFAFGSRPPEDGGGLWSMIRTARGKFVRFVEDDERHHYDLERDPYEQQDWPSDARSESVRAQLEERLSAWWKRWAGNEIRERAG